MLKQTNLHSEKAKDLTIIAVVCEAKNFKANVSALELADPKHKRYTLFKHINHWEKVRGQRWDGYIEMWWSEGDNKTFKNVVRELESRGVKFLKVNRTTRGPIIEHPKQSEVNS